MVSAIKNKIKKNKERSTEETHLNQTETSEKSFPGGWHSRIAFVAVVLKMNMSYVKERV